MLYGAYIINLSLLVILSFIFFQLYKKYSSNIFIGISIFFLVILMIYILPAITFLVV